MFEDPIYRSHRLFLSHDFIYPEIHERFDPYFQEMNTIYEDMIAYINASISSAFIPGLSDQLSRPQVYNQGITKQYRSALQPYEGTMRDINVTFKHRNNYFNWIVMLTNLRYFLQHEKQTNTVFLPDINLHLYDDLGNIMYWLVYKQITLKSMAGLDLRKTDNGISGKDFVIQFHFNILDLNFYYDKKNINVQKKQEYIY